MDNSPMLSTPSLRPDSVTGTDAPVTQRPSRPASHGILNSGTRTTKVSSRYLLVVRQAGQLRGESKCGQEFTTETRSTRRITQTRSLPGRTQHIHNNLKHGNLARCSITFSPNSSITYVTSVMSAPTRCEITKAIFSSL